MRQRPALRHLMLIALFAAIPRSAAADSLQDMKSFRIGLVAEPGYGNAIAGLAALKNAYSKAIGLPVQVLVAPDYAALIDAQASVRIDYAIYTASAYAAAYELCRCVEPVALSAADTGAVGLRAVLVTRDGRLPSLAAMKDHRIAIGSPDSVASYQLPLSALPAAGAAISRDSPFLVRAQDAAAAEKLLVDGAVDAIFGWAPAAPEGQPEIAGGTVARLVAAGLDPSSLKVMWTSGTLSFGPHAVRADLDPEVKRRVSVFLLGLAQSDPDLYERLGDHRSGGFVAVTHQDYATALAMVRAVAALAQPAE